MGTAEGNRLRPEEHTTGAPVVMRAAVHKSFSALEAEVGGVADPRDHGRVARPVRYKWIGRPPRTTRALA